MPTVTLNKKVFESLVGKKLTLSQLKDRISMLGTDLDEITDREIDVEIFPNRPDMLSEQGFARAFSSFIGVKKGLRTFEVKDSGQKVIIDKSAALVRPCTACAIVKGLNFSDEKIREVIQIQEKLHTTYGRNRKKCAIGIYPLEKIKMPITYKALSPKKISFIPLEAKEEMDGNAILEKHPAGKEYAHLLEGKKAFPIFMDAAGEVVSMPPIINSHTVGKVSENTKDVFVECSGFELNTLSICLNIIVTALAEMGGIVYSVNLAYPDKKVSTPNLSPREMSIDVEYANRILGISLKEKDLISLLEQMGYGWKNGKALIPAYRADILHPIDIVEDAAIAYGYENFRPEIPSVSTIAKESEFEVFKKRLSYLIVGLGYTELNTYNIAGKTSQQEKMNCNIAVIHLANALNKEYDVLRAWIIPSLMEVFANNKHNDYPQKIFDIGTVFKKGNTETGVVEQERLAVAKCGEDADYTQARQIAECIMNHLGVPCRFKEAEHSSFIHGRTARMLAGKKEIAYVGEIRPDVLENWDLTMPVCAVEINLTELFELI